MNERREFKRFNIEADVVLRPQDGTSRVIKADLYTICFLGAGVYATEEIEANSIVKCELTSKLSKETIVCEGKVIYVCKVKEGPACIFRIGINFINVDSAKNQVLFNFIQRDIILQEKNRRVF
jgi:hypothetical protein